MFVEFLTISTLCYSKTSTCTRPRESLICFICFLSNGHASPSEDEHQELKSAKFENITLRFRGTTRSQPISPYAKRRSQRTSFPFAFGSVIPSARMTKVVSTQALWGYLLRSGLPSTTVALRSPAYTTHSETVRTHDPKNLEALRVVDDGTALSPSICL